MYMNNTLSASKNNETIKCPYYSRSSPFPGIQKKAGVITLPSGLQYKPTKSGLHDGLKKTKVCETKDKGCIWGLGDKTKLESGALCEGIWR